MARSEPGHSGNSDVRFKRAIPALRLSLACDPSFSGRQARQHLAGNRRLSAGAHSTPKVGRNRGQGSRKGDELGTCVDPAGMILLSLRLPPCQGKRRIAVAIEADEIVEHSCLR